MGVCSFADDQSKPPISVPVLNTDGYAHGLLRKTVVHPNIASLLPNG